MKGEVRWIGSLLLAPVVGFLCFLLPILAAGDAEKLAAPESVNLVLRAFENVNPIPTAILLLLAGFAFRYFARRGTVILALLLVAPFPLATVFGVLTTPEHHNLLPLELALEFASIVPGLVGALAASAFAKRKQAS